MDKCRRNLLLIIVRLPFTSLLSRAFAVSLWMEGDLIMVSAVKQQLIR